MRTSASQRRVPPGGKSRCTEAATSVGFALRRSPAHSAGPRRARAADRPGSCATVGAVMIAASTRSTPPAGADAPSASSSAVAGLAQAHAAYAVVGRSAVRRAAWAPGACPATSRSGDRKRWAARRRLSGVPAQALAPLHPPPATPAPTVGRNFTAEGPTSWGPSRIPNPVGPASAGVPADRGDRPAQPCWRHSAVWGRGLIHPAQRRIHHAIHTTSRGSPWPCPAPRQPSSGRFRSRAPWCDARLGVGWVLTTC